MRTLTILLVLVLAILAPVENDLTWVQPEAQVSLCAGYIGSPLDPLGFQTITVAGTSIGFTLPAGTRMAVASVQVDNIRYRDDGTAPTATVGTLVTAGSSIVVCAPSTGPFRMIRQTNSATVSVSYYGTKVPS